ncbi:MAG: clostripain-related cysteine peptidase [Candidatus Heimdallarchaeota archaeon]
MQNNQIISQENLPSEPIVIGDDLEYDWVVMVYLDGDNDELELGFGSSTRIKIIVLLDRAEGYDTTNGDWTGTRIYEVVSDDTTTIASTLLCDKGELNMANGEVLEDFIDFCFTNYVSDQYWLNIWDHGGGIDGICWDETSVDKLTMEEMQVAIQANIDEHGRTLDIISHDACYMNMIEVAYEFKDQADYFIASEESIPFAGFDYAPVISALDDTSTMNAATLSTVIVDSYESFYNPSVDYTALSTINLSIMDVVAKEMSYFASNLSIVISDGNGGGINSAFLDTQFFYDYFIVDLVHFVENIQANATLMSSYPLLSMCATNILNALADLIVDNYQHSCYSSNANGITIFMCANIPIYEPYIQNYLDVTGSYVMLDWQSDTLWDEFLGDFYTANFGQRVLPYDVLAIGTSTGTQSLSEDEDHYYQFYVPDYGIYEITSEVFSGDTDLYLYGGFDLTLMGYSELYNPEDSTTEAIQLHFQPGTYVINVFGYSVSSYDLIIEEIIPISLILGNKVKDSSGTLLGDNSGHYTQTYNHYYQYTFDTPGEYYLKLTYNSNAVDFDLHVMTETFFEIDSSEEMEGLDTLYLTITESVTYIIYIYSFSGEGSFTFTMKSYSPGFINGFTIFISTISLIAVGAYVLRKKE